MFQGRTAHHGASAQRSRRVARRRHQNVSCYVSGVAAYSWHGVQADCEIVGDGGGEEWHCDQWHGDKFSKPVCVPSYDVSPTLMSICRVCLWEMR